jgi:putative FmdB family regulatory protein
VPLYEYHCDRCGRFEVIRKFSDPPLTKCTKCGGPIQRLPSAPAIQFKGTGWYVTDYAKKSGSEGSGSEGSKSGGESKGDEGSKGKDAGKNAGKDAGKDGKETSASSSSSSSDTSPGSTKGDTAKSETPKKATASGSKRGS